MEHRIRELQGQDIPVINQWRNDRELVARLGNNFTYIAEEVDAAWYEDYLRNREKARRFAILCKDGSRLIGMVQLTNIHVINRSAEFSIFIGEKGMRGRGVGQSAAREIVRHGFEDLNLYRIYLTVLSENLQAIHIYEKLGFVQEGILRGAVYKQGRFDDLLMMSILREEYFIHEQRSHTTSADSMHNYIQP